MCSVWSDVVNSLDSHRDVDESDYYSRVWTKLNVLQLSLQCIVN